MEVLLPKCPIAIHFLYQSVHLSYAHMDWLSCTFLQIQMMKKKEKNVGGT